MNARLAMVLGLAIAVCFFFSFDFITEYEYFLYSLCDLFLRLFKHSFIPLMIH